MKPYSRASFKATNIAADPHSLGNTLRDLALVANGDTPVDDLSAFLTKDNNHNEIAVALADLQKQQRQESAKKAAVMIMELVSRGEERKISLVEQIRAARRAEAEALRQLKALETAKSYGAATSNWLPLANSVDGLEILSDDNTLQTVPSNWASKTRTAVKRTRRAHAAASA